MDTLKSLILIFVALPVFLIAQPTNQEWINHDGDVKLLGKVTAKRLQQKPFKSWYQENQKLYAPDSKTVEEIQTQIDQVDVITIFMGTWCGDSKREVPRMIELLEASGFDMNKLSIICVDRSFNAYKQSPNREEAGKNIHRVPTMILHADSIEVGRIVESPIISLESDLASILAGKDYRTKYPVVYELNRLINDEGTGYLKENREALALKFKDEAHSVYELNTYGYQLLTSWDIEAALEVLQLNTYLYPSEEVPHETLGKVYQLLGKRDQAKTCFSEVLKLNPENEDIKNRLKELSS